MQSEVEMEKRNFADSLTDTMDCEKRACIEHTLHARGIVHEKSTHLKLMELYLSSNAHN